MKRATKRITRDTELGTKAAVREKLLKLYSSIDEGFRNQARRADDQLDYWDVYNCVLGSNQYYSGTSKIFVPLVHNAVKARKTRFVNQLFPRAGRYVDAVSMDGAQPFGIAALLEHYVRKAKLRTEIAPALCVAGDIEGQYNLYVSWSTMTRKVTQRVEKPLRIAGAEVPEELEEPIEDIEDEVIFDEHPTVEVISDPDVLILPVTCDSIDAALEQGGSVTLLRRYTKAQIEDMIDAGEVIEENAELLLEEMSKAEKEGYPDTAKHHADAAGVKDKGRVALIYETWTRMKVGAGDQKERRLLKVLFGSEKHLLSAKLCPFWNDRCPLISAPVDKVPGILKGKSQVEPVCQLQYAANDAVNEGMDSAAYALLPIIMTDPVKNPRVSTMVLDLAAVWQTNPNDTKIVEFPSLWKSAFEIIGACKSEIQQTLSVSPAMMSQSTGGKNKRNQAEIAQEQQVEILATADAVTTLEDGVFTQMLQRFAEYDMQFRTNEMLVKSYGHLGVEAAMERIPPQKQDAVYSFLWFGVEQARNAAQLQQQIALLNVVRGIPPQMLPGHRINMVPAVEHAMASLFGPRIAPRIFEDVSKMYSFDPEEENEIMAEGHPFPVSPTDDDMKHMEAHLKKLREGGDPHGFLRQHLIHHKVQMGQKAQAQAQQQNPSSPGTPGGGGGQPGVAGVPRPGGQVAGPRLLKGPTGAIPPDQMPRAGAVGMPRKM